MLCASPKRAEADLEFASADPAVKASVLARHLKDGVKNPRVLAVIDGWKVEGKTAEQKVAELDSLTHDALLSSKCQLREVLAR
ncbi:MAG: hypothetical protein JWO36_2969 [Myxococcales bacterium]|nr:hypothetical protein [Myxococcales bacterium]